MKKLMVVSSVVLGIGYCLSLLLDESQKRKVIAAEKQFLKRIWCNSIELINPVPCSTADQDAVPCSTADQDDSSSPNMPDGDDEFTAETRHVSPHFLTKIESFSLLSEYGIEKYETRVFESGDYKWYVPFFFVIIHLIRFNSYKCYFHRGGGRSSDRRRKAAAKHRRMAVVEKRRTSVVEQRWLSSGAKRWLSSGAGRTAVAEQRQTSTLTEVIKIYNHMT
ncbi:PREDICTED: uncharacterized protein LOC105959911 [Erythranthe guttata]|uniref:uncharacterized protein LOC105959911 n=1 Tax=Erythranthe guttata TaxID=4155 RepID=UPI00064D9B7B|nr:PREDICTED: uncharacterized protein LOC105959911 [Erythranthe guttata]|eukprot:XP_012839525.1 PREDICTED: uncharacterized protein LOC105959911 [Erythranthe guttata]